MSIDKTLTTFLGMLELFLGMVSFWKVSSFAMKYKCDFYPHGELSHVCLFFLNLSFVMFSISLYPRGFLICVHIQMRTGTDQASPL